MATDIERSGTRVDVENVVIVTYGASKDMLISYTSIMRQHIGLQPLIMKPELSKQAQEEADRLTMRGHMKNPAHFGSITKAKSWYSDRRVLNVLRKIIGIPPLLSGKSACFSCVLDQKFSSFGIYVSKSPITHKLFAVQIFSTGH